MERTFVAIKPDGVQRGLVGEIIGRFERKGYKLAGMKLMKASEQLAGEHYADLADKPFYKGLVQFLSSGPLCAMVWEGKGVVKGGRTLIGATNPADSLPGSIRGDLSVDIGRNVIHGSDAVETANREIALWFGADEVIEWDNHSAPHIYE